jgi:hypothetical protein
MLCYKHCFFRCHKVFFYGVFIVSCLLVPTTFKPASQFCQLPEKMATKWKVFILKKRQDAREYWMLRCWHGCCFTAYKCIYLMQQLYNRRLVYKAIALPMPAQPAPWYCLYWQNLISGLLKHIAWQLAR